MVRLLLLTAFGMAFTSVSISDRPTDCPCVSWRHGDCHRAINGSLGDYIPAIYGSYEWFPVNQSSGACAACPCPSMNGKEGPDGQGCGGNMACAFIFPCFAGGNGNAWGHHDVLVFGEGEPCNAALPNGSDFQTCDQWWMGKGPAWERFGWQLTQQGARPDSHAGQLIEHNGFYLARSTQASPFPHCGTGDVGWVQLQADGTLGCMQ